MSSCVGLVYFESVIGLLETPASHLSYELGVNGEKKSMETGILLIKINICTFHTGKPGNFNRLRDV